MLGFLNDWNMIKFTNKGTSSEDFDEIHKILLDGISGNTNSLLQTGKYGATNKTDKKWYVMLLNTCLTHLYYRKTQLLMTK